MIYLDWASTTPPDLDLLLEAARLAGECYGNPSSPHELGKNAKAKLEEARAGFLSLLGAGAKRGKLIFTGSGTEADNLPLLALLRKSSKDGSKPHVVLSEIEHAALYEEAAVLSHFGIQTTFVRPAQDGLIAPAALAAALRPETELVCVMAVNNETGAVQSIAELVQAVATRAAELGKRRPRFHVDAVQAFGKVPFAPAELGADSAAFSAHKLRGPRGSGALWLARDLEPLVLGGGQEGGLRPGTESLQNIWAFWKAARHALENLQSRREHARLLEARLIAGLQGLGALPLPLGRQAGDERYSPFIISAAFPGLSGEVLARALAGPGPGGEEGIAVSTGAACSSNAHKKGRRVLEAMGLDPELSLGSIRVSTGELSRADEVDSFLGRAGELYRKLRA